MLFGLILIFKMVPGVHLTSGSPLSPAEHRQTKTSPWARQFAPVPQPLARQSPRLDGRSITPLTKFKFMKGIFFLTKFV